MSWILKFLPSLTGSIGAFLNPWVILAFVGAYGAGVASEMWQQSKRNAAQEAVQEYAQKLRDMKLAQLAEEARKRKETSDAQANNYLAELRRHLDGEPDRQRVLIDQFKADAKRNGADWLSGTGPGAGSGGAVGGVLCFEGNQLAGAFREHREQLRSELARDVEQLRAEVGALAVKGQKARIVADVCSRWAVAKKR